MRVEEVVGWQVRERREARGLTQEQLGKELEPLLGRPWSRQAVSAAEKGDRAFGAAELVALADVLGTTVGDLLKLPIQEQAVDLGGAAEFKRDRLLKAIMSRPREDLNWLLIQTTLHFVAEAAARGQGDLARVLELTQNLDAQLTKRVADGGIVSFPLAGPGVSPTPLNGEGASRDGDQ